MISSHFKLQEKLNSAWYDKTQRWPLLLSPLAWLYKALASYSKSQKMKNQWQAQCPLIVVGNISIGGTGKSPLTIALISELTDRGYKVGVVSRGYGSQLDQYPYQVKETDLSDQVGDEPLMIVKRTKVNLVIDPDRVRACQYLLANNDCDLIISDDGLQHYALGRDIEICVIDSARGLGNGHLIPVGPLRESAERLLDVDFIIANGSAKQATQSLSLIEQSQNHEKRGELAPSFSMQLSPQYWQQLNTPEQRSLPGFNQYLADNHFQVTAMAGIGNPGRFFETLSRLGVTINQQQVFADHYQYKTQDFNAIHSNTVLCMTEKDAVKCENYVPEQSYYLKIAAELECGFIEQLCAKLAVIAVEKKRTHE